MKKWTGCIFLVMGLSLLCSCQRTENAKLASSSDRPVYPELTYCFVPDNSGAHMFDIIEVNPDGSRHNVLLKATNVGFNQPDWSSDGTVMAIWGWHSPMTISIYTYDVSLISSRVRFRHSRRTITWIVVQDGLPTVTELHFYLGRMDWMISKSLS